MKKALSLLALLMGTLTAMAQAVGIGTTSPVASAQLEVRSTIRGFLPPRMTTAQRNAIASPTAGLVIYNTTTNSLELRNNSDWVTLSAGLPSAPIPDALPTIQIGTQRWMTRNLDVAFYRNGDPIPQVTDPAIWPTLTTGAWCYQNNDPILGAKYGKLYNWYAINDPRGLAPQGWHIPTDDEWTILETTLGGAAVAGGKMKEPGTTNWISPNTGADNSSSWAGLPGGTRFNTATFFNLGDSGYWWSTTESGGAGAACRNLTYFNSTLGRNFFNRNWGFSVRCIRH